MADIKIAVRSQKTAKSAEFMRRAMAECDSIDVERLSRAALAGTDALREYLMGNDLRRRRGGAGGVTVRV